MAVAIKILFIQILFALTELFSQKKQKKQKKNMCLCISCFQLMHVLQPYAGKIPKLANVRQFSDNQCNQTFCSDQTGSKFFHDNAEI